uniref:YdeI/OmpD-associated family protein n=1 Tax=Paenibacillus sp. FSL L8-0340 TaxID=2954685 RepID=UPI00406CA90F
MQIENLITAISREALRGWLQVYENFLAFPALYQRVRIDTIQSNIKQPDLFESRLDKFIINTKENKMYGQWHDNGRLLDY